MTSRIPSTGWRSGRGTRTIIDEIVYYGQLARLRCQVGLGVEVTNERERRLYERLGYLDRGHGVYRIGPAREVAVVIGL